MKYPEGAMRTREELEALLERPSRFYIVDIDYPNVLIRRTDEGSHFRYGLTRYHTTGKDCFAYTDENGDYHACPVDNLLGMNPPGETHAFTNYWLAHAHWLRIKSRGIK